MQWPSEIGVMILPNVILFPQAYLPLYIFEPRYRRMLAHALDTHRMFCVALQRPQQSRESPTPVAGIGLIRAAVERPDGTSHLVVQGLSRVELGEATRYRPYRAHRIRVLESKVTDSVVIDALTARLLELVADRLRHLASSETPAMEGPHPVSEGLMIPGLGDQGGAQLLAQVSNPDQIADLVSWTLLTDPAQRQVLLETLDLETRLKRLIQYLLSPPRHGAEAV